MGRLFCGSRGTPADTDTRTNLTGHRSEASGTDAVNPFYTNHPYTETQPRGAAAPEGMRIPWKGRRTCACRYGFAGGVWAT